VQGLIEKGLVERQQAPGERVPKFRHDIGKLLGSDDARVIAVATLLLLRGPQTPGELKTRSERLCQFASTAEVEGLLQELCAAPEPFVARLPRQHGQKETRYTHLFSPIEAKPPIEASPRYEEAAAPAQAALPAPGPDRLAALEARVAALEARAAAAAAALGGLQGSDTP